MGTSFSSSSAGLNTPNSVTIPPVMSDPGVTSKAGFQQLIPANTQPKKGKLLRSISKKGSPRDDSPLFYF